MTEPTWEYFEECCSKLENRHVCTIIRRGDGMGICSACIIQTWIDSIYESWKYDHE